METAHEAAVAHLKTLDRAEHPELEEVLAVARMYPVEVQRACEDAVKRGEDSAVLYPVKAIADRQAVEIQELLDALTSPVPSNHLRDFATADVPLDPTQPAGPVSTTLPKHPGDPDPNLPGEDANLANFRALHPADEVDAPKSALFPHEVVVGDTGAAATGQDSASTADSKL